MLYNLTIKRKLKLSNLEQYDLGDIGRNKINNRIYKKVLWKKNRTLQPEDILGTLDLLTKTKYN